MNHSSADNTATDPSVCVRTVAQKMGVRAGSRAHIAMPGVSAAGPPAPVTPAMCLPELEMSDRLQGQFDYLHLFVANGRQLSGHLPTLREHLRPGGMLWVSWPRGRAFGSDLTLPEVIRISYDQGLVESTCLRVDSVWSGLKLTHPKPGKSYHNSHGVLPNQRHRG